MTEELKVHCTTNYDLFELHPINREVQKEKKLRDSIRRYGPRPEFPIGVVPNGNGKYQIKFGHHRFFVCRELGVPVYYIIAPDDEFPIHTAEETTRNWNLRDFMVSHNRAGTSDAYRELKMFHESTGIPLSCCVGMLAGELAASQNHTDRFKRGEYTIRPIGREHAEKVARIIRHCEAAGCHFAKHANFVKAVSRIAWVPHFDEHQLYAKLRRAPTLLEPCTSVEGYVEGLSRLYAYGTSTNKLQLMLDADEAARSRNAALRSQARKAQQAKPQGARKSR